MPIVCSGRDCQAVIDWAVRPDGTGRHPITRPAPCAGSGARCTHEGTLAVWRDGPRLHWRPLKAGESLNPGEHRARSHYADCPNADDFRCPRCKHKRHSQPCTKLGKIECRRDPAGALIRGRFPCGCTDGVAQ